MLARFKLEKHKGGHGRGLEEDGKTSKSKKFRPKHFGETSHSRRTSNDSSRKDKSKISSNRKFSKHKDIKKANMIDKKKVLKEKWQSSRRTTKISYKPPEKSRSSATGNIDKAQEKTTSSSVPAEVKLVKSPLVLPETTLNLSDRPIRAAAATAQAISEAQQEFLDTEPPPEYKRNKHGQIEILVDKPPKPRKYVKKKISSQEVGEESPEDKSQEKKPEVIYTDETLEQNVERLVGSFKNQYLSMINRMQGNVFLRNMEIQFKNEKNRRDLLSKRVSQLESQIENLAQESLEMLKYSLKELGIEATNPPQFIDKAKDIVCMHNELQKKKINLESEVLGLQQEQVRLTKEKERQLSESLVLNKSSHNLTDHDIQQVVQNEINLCTKIDASTLSDKKHLDITLTKVDEERRCWREINQTQDDNNNNNGIKYSLSKIDFDDEDEACSQQNNHSKSEEVINQVAFMEAESILQRGDPRLKDSRNTHKMPYALCHPTPHQPRLGEFNAAVMSHISSEIERNMRRGEVPVTTVTPQMFLPQWPVSSSGQVTIKRPSETETLPLMSSASRMAQVIEDSLRGPPAQEEIKKNVPKKTTKKSSTSNNIPMEGLASRFETCFSSQDIGMQSVTSDQGVRNNKRKREMEGGARRTETPGDNVSETSVKTEESGDSDQWQRKITSGFDRLVALASEVDKRRQSSSEAAPVRVTAEVMSSSSSSSSGDKLPERHFKKKYFDQEYQKRQQQNQS